LGVDQGKALIYARLKLQSGTTYDIDKETGEILSTNHQSQPGYIHFANDACFDDEFFAQLTAEKLVTKKRAGREIQEWKKERARNEALDCTVYALATYRLAKDTPIIKSRIAAQAANQNNTIKSNQNNQTTEPTKPRRRRGR